MKTDKIPKEEAWINLLETLRPIKEIRGEQLPKALEDYPELTISLSSNMGYLRFLIERARRRLRAGYDPGFPDKDELDDWVCGGVPEDVHDFWGGDIDKGRDCFERADRYIPGLDIEPILLETITCEDLIEQYREAVKCFENIPDGLRPGEYMEAVENCQNQLEEIRQKLVDEGCICDLLYEEYKAAVECFENIPDGLSDSEHFEAVQSCLEKLEYVQSRMIEWGCEY